MDNILLYSNWTEQSLWQVSYNGLALIYLYMTKAFLETVLVGDRGSKHGDGREGGWPILSSWVSQLSDAWAGVAIIFHNQNQSMQTQEGALREEPKMPTGDGSCGKMQSSGSQEEVTH